MNNTNISSFQACTTKQTQLHHKLLLAHKTLSDKYKLLQAKLNSQGIASPADVTIVLDNPDLVSDLCSFADINSRVGGQGCGAAEAGLRL